MKGGKPDTLTVPDLDALAAQPTRLADWTKEQDDILRRYYGKGHVTPAIVADYINATFRVERSPQTVIRRAYILRQRGEL
jgi:hypothetical protein